MYTLISGSPKIKPSNSMFFLNKVKQSLEEYSFFELKKHKYDEIIKSIEESQVIVLAFPLYVDSPPSLTLEFLDYIIENKIDLKQCLADYFDTDDETSQFEKFANEVIVPFKNAIAYLFDIEGANKFKQEVKKEEVKEPAKKAEPSNKLEKYFADIKTTCDEIVGDTQFVKIKPEQLDDINYLVDLIKAAADKKDTKITNALVIGLCYVLKQVKKLRFYERELRDALETLYLS
jgi:hypothetical protein